jgi:hypothetical protein
MQRLPDRGLTKGLASYYKRVYEIAYRDRPAVLIELRNPAKLYVLDRYVEGMKMAAAARANAPRLLEDDRSQLCLVVSHEGSPVTDIRMAAEAIRQLRRLRDHSLHERRVVPPRYVVRAAGVAGRHGELRWFARLYDQLVDQLRRSQLGLKAGPGVEDPALWNFCHRGDRVSLVDFDHYTPSIELEYQAGFTVGDALIVSRAHVRGEQELRLWTSTVLQQIQDAWVGPEWASFSLGFLSRLSTEFNDYAEGSHHARQYIREYARDITFALRYCLSLFSE